jgi:hypothetical protein
MTLNKSSEMPTDEQAAAMTAPALRALGVKLSIRLACEKNESSTYAYDNIPDVEFYSWEESR